MEITGIIAILLFVIISGVLLYFSLRTWPVYMVILVFFVMLASGTAMVLAARTIKSWNAWGSVERKWEVTVNKNEADLQKVYEGDENASGEEIDPETGKQRETAAKYGLTQLQSDLNEVHEGRGRVWGIAGALWKMDEPGGINIVGSFDGQSKLDLTFSAKDAPADPQMTSGMLLYAFAVTQKDFQGSKVPAAFKYLGHFRVASKDALKASLTLLENSIPEENIQAVTNQPIVLYEKYPLDTHLIGKSDDEIKAMLAGSSKQTVEEFLDDGKPAANMNFDNMSEDEKKLMMDQIWWRVKFKKTITQAELNQELGLKSTAKKADPNNPDAEVEAVEIKEGQVAEFDPTSAQKLIEKGIAEPDDKNEEGAAKPYKVFVRKLRDYPQIVMQLRKKAEVLRSETAELNRLTQINKVTEQSLTKVIASHKANTDNLNYDLEFVNKEQAALEKYSKELSAQIKEKQEYRDKILMDIASTSAEIKQLQLKSAERIEMKQNEAAKALEKSAP